MSSNPTTSRPAPVLHPEVIGDRFEGAKDAGGRPLVHAEGTSKPIRARMPHEPQPRGARDRGNHPVDQIGSCTNVCPVKINIHEQIFVRRKVMSEEHRLPFVKSEMMKVLGYVLARPALYRAALGAADEALRLLPHFVLANSLNTWTNKGRDMPEAPTQTFHAWWRERRGQTRKSP